MTIEVHNAEANVSWVNASGASTDQLAPHIGKVAREIANWVQSTQRSANPSLFNRAAYVAPDNPYSLMSIARNAVENDDVVGGVCDVTEGLIFQGAKWESTEADDADVFNQIARDLNLDEFLRQWHREDYTHSQAVVGVWWGRKTYIVRGRTVIEDAANMRPDPTNPMGMRPGKKRGPKRKRKYDIATPVALTFLDPTKVVPLKPGPFGQDRLAWHATREEYAAATAAQDGMFGDAVLGEFTTGPIRVSAEEASYLQSIGIDSRRLLGLNPMAVFRICRTKMSYDRYVIPRLKSVFALLDLKQQLMEADRVSLVGAANFILLVKQGSKEDPALPEELDNLRENFKVIAKLPVVIGDHRLNIEIITPDQEYVLDGAKYDTLDRRIMSRCLGALAMPSSRSNSNETSDTLSRGVARLLENRRHMLKRVLEKELARAIVEHPHNEGKFDDEPNLTFTPRNVQLGSDAQITQAIMALRNSNDLSRESTLEYFGFDQMVEALRREFEDESGLDDIFQTHVPFSAMPGGNQNPNGGPEAPQNSGARGGRPVGGGESPKSPQGQMKTRTSKGNPSTGGK